LPVYLHLSVEIGDHALLKHELVESMCIARIFDQTQQYLFVGTAITLPSEPERSIGRILMYQVTSSRTYQLVEAVNVPGVVYCIKPYKNSITAAVNGSVSHMICMGIMMKIADNDTHAFLFSSTIFARTALKLLKASD
jgi:hypothetical protein